MKKLVLIGGGGHCKSVLDATERMSIFDEIVITDPALEAGTNILGYTVVGSDDILDDLRNKGFDYAFITVGDVGSSELREKILKRVYKYGFQFPVIIDPSSFVSKHSSIGEGTFIGKNTVVNTDAIIGMHCIINTGAIIEHECEIGNFSHISIGAILGGGTKVGNGSFIGAGSTVNQCKEIGNNSIIGAGAVVNKDLPDNCTAVGIPARVIKQRNQ